MSDEKVEKVKKSYTILRKGKDSYVTENPNTIRQLTLAMSGNIASRAYQTQAREIKDNLLKLFHNSLTRDKLAPQDIEIGVSASESSAAYTMPLSTIFSLLDLAPTVKVSNFRQGRGGRKSSEVEVL